jgi:hypothetical protein
MWNAAINMSSKTPRKLQVNKTSHSILNLLINYSVTSIINLNMNQLDLSTMGLDRLISSSKAGKILLERALNTSLIELNLSGNQL